MRNKAIAPSLDFLVNHNTEGTVENRLISFIEQSDKDDRSFITKVLSEEKKDKIEKELKELIHKAATQMGVDQNIASQVQMDLDNDLLRILNEENLSNLNKNILKEDIKSGLKKKHKLLLENQVETSRFKIVWKGKESTGQDDSQMELSDIVDKATQESIEISGGNDAAKTTLTK